MAQSVRHLVDTDAPKVSRCRGGGVAVEERNLTPGGLLLVRSGSDRTAERVRIRHPKDASAAVDLHIGEVVAPDSKARRQSGLSSVLELDQPRHESWNADLERFACPRTLLGFAFRIEDAAHPAHPACRTEQADERCEVVGTDVEHRTTARLIEDAWIGMPVLRPAIEHESGSSQGLSELAPLQQQQAGLNPGAEKRVRRTSDLQPARRSFIENRLPVLSGGGAWLFRVYVLA